MNNTSKYLSDLNSKPGSSYLQHSVVLKSSPQIARKVMKAFLLGSLHELFLDLINTTQQSRNDIYKMESYQMDSKIIQFLIQGILDSGDYTLEGIAYYTHIPFDIIYDAACGISNQFSITLWAKIVTLYLQVKPDVANLLTDRLLEVKNKNHSAFSTILHDS